MSNKAIKDVVFKCNWNDGNQSQEPGYSGWDGVCSWEVMRQNVSGKLPRPWCSNKKCACAEAVLGLGRKHRRQIREPCFESILFRKGVFSPGPRKRVAQTARGKLAIFTSRRPNDEERQRVIIGAMRIAEIEDKTYFRDCLAVVGEKDSVIRLREAEMLLYWDLIEPPKGGPAWDTGLTRYLKKQEVDRILLALERKGVDIARLGPRDLAVVRRDLVRGERIEQ